MKSVLCRFVALLSLLLVPLTVRADLFVSDNFGNQILRYNETTGAFLGTVVPTPDGINGSRLSAPTGMQIGPDGLLWVANGQPRFPNANGVPNSIQRYTLGGAYVDTFAINGNLNAPSDMKFGPDGQLYVANLGGESTGFQGDSVLRFSPSNGSVSTKLGVGNVSGASYLNFVGNTMLVSNYNFNPLNTTFAGSVQRYDLTTGLFAGNLIANGASGLQAPTGLAIQGGNIYVADTFGAAIKRYNATTGAFVDNFATIPIFPQTDGPFPSDILFQGTDLLVAELGYSMIAKFNSAGVPTTFAAGSPLLTPGYFLVTAIPEPTTWAGLVMAGIGLGWCVRRKRAV